MNHYADTPRSLPFSLVLSLYFKNPIFWIGAVFTLVGIPIILLIVFTVNFAAMGFSPEAQLYKAKITAIEETNTSVNGRRVMKYEYTWYSQGAQAGNSFSYSNESSLQVGDWTLAERDPENKLTRLQGMDFDTAPSWFLFIFLIFPIIGGTFLFFAIKKALHQSHLIKHGILAKGKLTRMAPTHTQINNQTVFEVYFEFKSLHGTTTEAMIRTHEVGRVQDEQEELLVYLAEDPTQAYLLDAMPGQVKNFFSSL
ncbi:MAG: hypothetical protein MUF42_15400 [Cytophagaceae bacterium]|nr:hypothetical protein [Cytophagaceae bacterium]